MKKALDQTVRELKREVNKKVLKVPGIEQKILDATSNEPWGPHGQLLMDIAQATRNYHEYQMIMNVIWKRINDIGKNWRHVYKALIVLDYLVAHGSERVIDEIKEHVYQISTLSDFQYIDSSGRDQGSNVRRKCQSLVALVNDKERIQEVRQKALANKDKYRSPYSTSGTYRSSPSSGKGGYGDRYDDERFEDRYGNKDVVRNGYGRERDWTHQNDDYGRGGDSYNRDGDLYGRDSDERYGRGSYRGDDYRGGRGNDDQFESRDRNTDRDRNSDRDRARSFDDDDRYSSRSGGGRADDASQEERQPERKLSEQNAGAPPSYEEVIRDAHNHVRTERDGGTLAAPGPKVFLSSASKSGSPSESTIQGSNHVVADVSVSTQSKEVNDFDEFDPRGSVSAAAPAASTSEMDFFGTDPINSLALVPVTSATYSPEADIPTNSGFGTNFVALSSASTTWSQASEDPFGETPFKAAPQENFPAQQQNFAPATSFQPPSGSVGGAEPIAAIPSFDFGDSLGGLTYAPSVLDGQHSSVNPAFFAPELQPIPPQFGAAALASSQGTQPAAQTYLQTANMSLLSQPGPSAPLGPQASLHSPYGTQPVAPANFSTTPMNILQQSGLSAPAASQAALTTSAGPSARPSKDKLEPKSAVWADTLSRGLVNLDISGAKINPLADIGIDFESINRMEKRKEKKSSAAPVTSTITMGRAMGSGSGIGRAGASGLAPSPNPMGSGMGMGGGAGMGMGMGMGMGGYGGRMNQQPMGMGMGMNMNMGMGMGMGMGMNMAMGQGAPMRSPTGVPASGQGMNGVGYNPMMGMGGYSSQQQYAGGYR